MKLSDEWFKALYQKRYADSNYCFRAREMTAFVLRQINERADVT